jgi:hypothetical protein
MIREAPAWFNDELERVGGTNRYGDAIFKLVWSEDPKMIVGGLFSDGFVGYKNVRAIPGEACWALMMWEGPETYGSPFDWEMYYRQPDTGCLDMGAFPLHGRYRLLKQFIHREVVSKDDSRMVVDPKTFELRREVVSSRKVVTHRMEPCGFILDMMAPMLMAWRRLTIQKKWVALMERKDRQDKELDGILRDAYHDGKIRPGSPLVQKRAELIEKNMDRAMAMAAKYGRGMNAIAA